MTESRGDRWPGAHPPLRVCHGFEGGWVTKKEGEEFPSRSRTQWKRGGGADQKEGRLPVCPSCKITHKVVPGGEGYVDVEGEQMKSGRLN